MQRLTGLKFLYITGKGGVGKSTVAAAVSCALAQQGNRVLLAYEAEALGQGRLLGVQKSPHVQEVLPNLWAVAIEPELSMQEYAESILRSRRVASALFQNQVAKGFLSGVPGLSAWAFLGKAWFYAEPSAQGPEREVNVDTVVVDAPATGDSTDILRVPTIIQDLAPRGRLRRDAELCSEMLHDPQRMAVLPVTLLEELPVTETEELVKVVRQELRMPLGPLIINQTRETLFSEVDRGKLAGWLEDSPAQESCGNLERFISLAARRASAEHQALDLLPRLESLELPQLWLPHLRPEPQGRSGLASLARALAPPASRGYRADRP